MVFNNPSTFAAHRVFVEPPLPLAEEPRDEQYMSEEFVMSRCAHISCLLCSVPAVATSDPAKSVIGAWWRDTVGCHGKLRRRV